MMWAGIPLPQGIQPTDDTDGPIHLYDPDWTWPGRPDDPQYHGRIYELWGARSPEQNAADGLEPIWTAKYAGRLTGVNNRLIAHPINRTTGADVTSQAQPSFGAPKAPTDTGTQTMYWGLGTDGVYEAPQWMTTAVHIPMSHIVLRISDMVNGIIRHPMGFSLHGIPESPGTRVWPATGYDGASRTWMPQGSRLRLPAGYSASYPAAMPTAWRPMFDMFINCFRDYGILFVDTTGASFAMRAEPGIQPYLPSDFSGNAFLKYLPWEDMQMIAVGSDEDFYPGS